MKLSKTRRQIAWEAARLISEQPKLRHSDARRLAAERICPAGVRQHDVPTDQEVGEQLQSLTKSQTSPSWARRFAGYADLLRPLALVSQDPLRHPEGDALYHSLQVFALACERLPYDEEFLTAALLHDVGKAIERRNHIVAGLTALEGLVTPRTAWLIEQLPAAQEMAGGNLGSRARQRLTSAPDSEEVTLLAECDRAGRERGVIVPDLEDTLEHLEQMSLSHGDY